MRFRSTRCQPDRLVCHKRLDYLNDLHSAPLLLPTFQHKAHLAGLAMDGVVRDIRTQLCHQLILLTLRVIILMRRRLMI
jgi:hypothetical protein